MEKGYCGRPEWADKDGCPMDNPNEEMADCAGCEWYREIEVQEMSAAAEIVKPCPFGNKRCLCADCTGNAAYDDCRRGYCLECLECIDAGEQVHDVYLCTGHTSRKEKEHE